MQAGGRIFLLESSRSPDFTKLNENFPKTEAQTVQNLTFKEIFNFQTCPKPGFQRSKNGKILIKAQL